jgi:LPXTG-site transpeptidase (sortase) family protein
VLLFGGIYLLIYVGGLYIDVEFHRMAARGDSDIEAPRMVVGAVERPAPRADDTAAVPAQGQAPAALPSFDAPVLAADGQIASPLPDPAQVAYAATVERIVLPSIKVDAKVIEVGWDIIEEGGTQMAVWEVAEYAVGQHHGSANPGEGGNVVLAGHVGGYGKVFRDLYYVLPGDPVVLYSEGRQFQYVVTERKIVDEIGAPAEQRAANAAMIAPTDHEVVTMVTCWPLKGPNKFAQRVIIRAVPFGANAPASADIAPQTAR